MTDVATTDGVGNGLVELAARIRRLEDGVVRIDAVLDQTGAALRELLARLRDAP